MNMPEEDDGKPYTWEGKMSALLPTFDDVQVSLFLSLSLSLPPSLSMSLSLSL